MLLRRGPREEAIFLLPEPIFVAFCGDFAAVRAQLLNPLNRLLASLHQLLDPRSGLALLRQCFVVPERVLLVTGARFGMFHGAQPLP